MDGIAKGILYRKIHLKLIQQITFVHLEYYQELMRFSAAGTVCAPRFPFAVQGVNYPGNLIQPHDTATNL